MRATAVAALFLLCGCDGLFETCRACIEASPISEVPAGERSKIRLIGPGTLPENARELHFHERCGIDCMQWMRFDLPEGEARRFAAGVLGGAALRKGYDPFPDTIGGYAPPAMPWWPARFPQGAEGAVIRTQEARGGGIVLRAAGGQATIWFFEFDT